MKTKYTLLIGLGLIIGLSRCQKFVEGYDVSPNLAETAPLNQRLTAIEAAMGLSASGELPRLAGIWTGQFTGQVNQYDAFQNYVTQAVDFNTAWSFLYVGIGANARLTQQEADAAKDPWTKGIAQIHEAYAIGMAADWFGDVPYSQAFQTEKYPNPVFDPQSEVYAAMQDVLSGAITNLGSPTGGNIKTSDFFYQGNLQKWIAAAHSFKARYYLHTHNYPKAVEEAMMGISTPANDLLMPFPGTANGVDKNPYWDFSQNVRPGYMDATGAYAVQLLKNRNTAKTQEAGRLKFYYNAKENDVNYSEGGFGGASTAFPIISYAETQLILAECYMRLGQPADALTALNKVRIANTNNPNYQRFGTVNYEALTEADFSDQEALLTEILTEKYLTLFGHTELYNDARRKNNAALIGIPLKVNTSSSIPQRLFIPQNEISTNPNTPEQSPSDLFVPTPVNQ